MGRGGEIDEQTSIPDWFFILLVIKYEHFLIPRNVVSTS